MPQPDRAAPRMPELDALRGLAALVVLLHHAIQLIPWPAHDSLRDALPAILLATPLRLLAEGRGPVLFFFVLSGFVLTRALLAGAAPPGLARFAVQRSVRILLPAAAAVLLSAALREAAYDPAAARLVPGQQLYTWFPEPTPLRLLADLALLRNDFNVVLWSLAHEWRLTVLLPLVLLLRGRPLMLLALAALASVLGTAGGAVQDEVYLPREPLTGTAATLYFALGIGTGVALALAGPLPRLTREQAVAAALCAVAGFSLASDLAAYAASVALILLAAQPGRLRDALRGRLPVALGRVSYSLYLVHVPVLLAAWHGLHGVMPGTAAVLTGVALALPAAALFHRAVEEPARRLAARLGARVARLGAVQRAGG